MSLRRTAAAVLGSGLLLASCGVQTPEELNVAAYAFTENELVAEVYALTLENAGITTTVDREYQQGSREELGELFTDGTADIVPEYLGSLTGFVNATINGEEAQPLATSDVEETVTSLRELVADLDVEVLDPAGAQNQIEFAVRRAFAEEKSITSLSQLAALEEDLTFAGPEGCKTTRACLPGLEEVYGLTFAEHLVTDTGGPDTLNALTSERAEVGMVFATDPAVDARDLLVLEDDKRLEVANNVLPIVAATAASDEVIELLDRISAALTTDELRKLNGQVSIEGYPITFVAARWAAEQGLIPAEAVPATPTPTPPPTETPTPTPTPTPEPEPEPEPAPAAPAPPSGGGGYDRNRGEPSAAAQSQNWAGLAQCESGGNPTIISSNGLYHGLYQFSVPTWQSVGGSGAASSASPNEQTYRAQILWDVAGPGQWPVCQKFL